MEAALPTRPTLTASTKAGRPAVSVLAGDSGWILSLSQTWCEIRIQRPAASPSSLPQQPLLSENDIHAALTSAAAAAAAGPQYSAAHAAALTLSDAFEAVVGACQCCMPKGRAGKTCNRTRVTGVSLERGQRTEGTEDRGRSTCDGALLQHWRVPAVLHAMREGVVVDPAGWAAALASNTLTLQRDCGWKGVCNAQNPAH